MRLDLSALKYLTTEDFRVLIAIEMGMKNHEIVPVELIQSISKLKKANTSIIIANLLKHKLIKHTNIQYDGYNLNYLGYDFLAIHSLIKRGILIKIGAKLGVGKESDVFICYVKTKEAEISDEQYNKIKNEIYTENENDRIEDEEIGNCKEQKDDNNEEEEEEEGMINAPYQINDLPTQLLQSYGTDCHIAVIKIARLGRTSFRAVKNKRDYIKKQTHYNWLYLSRLSAMNEYKYMIGLFNNGFKVPRPYGYNRHAIVMEYIPSYSLCRIDNIKDKDGVYHQLINFLYRLGTKGLVHGDFNEFNILYNINTKDLYVIDFPQMISLDHIDAQKYFDRDVNCIKIFFKRKFGLTFDDNASFYDIKREEELDKELKAFGYKKEKTAQKRIEDRQKENEEGNILDDEDCDDNEERKEELINKLSNEDQNKEESKAIEDDLNDKSLSDDLDYENEIKENAINDNEIIPNANNAKFDNNENQNLNKDNKKKGYSKQDIKEKVKKMMNIQNKPLGNKMGNRFKGKKNIGMKTDLKHI